LDTAEGKGQGLDAGIKLSFMGLTSNESLPQRNFSLGLNLQDISGTTVLWNTTNHTRDQLPSNLLIGLSYSERLPWLNGRLTFSIGHDNGHQSSNHWGGEFLIKDIFSLRVGMQDNNLTAGAGLKIFWLRADYAFVSYDLGNSHRISGAVEF
jgi:hypothetical protein